MEKQNWKKDADLPQNHYITAKLKSDFNLVSTTHDTPHPCCTYIKAEILEAVNIIL